MDAHPIHRHHPHRPPLKQLSVPPRIPSSRLYPTPSYSSYSPSPFPFSPSSTPTPSKRRYSSYSSSASNSSSSRASSVFFLLFSLRSLYSLLPFLRSSSPSFSLFPFSFLVSLLSSFICFFSSSLSPSSKEPQLKSSLSLTRLSFAPSLLRPLAAKSSLLALVFLLRFQALRSCGTAATILAEYSGNVAAKFIAEKGSRAPGDRTQAVRGFASLVIGLFLLSFGWDRIGCFPLSSASAGIDGNCVRILPMLLPFLSGFVGFFERASANWGSLRQLGRKRVRMISLFVTTLILFVPAAVSFIAVDEDRVSIRYLGWPLVNTVVFGVILSENYGDDRVVFARDLQKDFLLTFFCTLVLELLYFPELALLGFLFCGLLLWFSVRELGSSSLNYPDLGSGSLETFSSTIVKPFRQILAERKSRKIALFLLINTAYMVVEFIAGFMSNSLGLISDACHMLFDCAALAIGLYASYISRLPASNQFNYGRARFEVLSGYVNAVLLVLVGALIVLESFERILDPQEISTNSLLTVSIGGLLVNVVGLIFFHEEHHHAHGSCSHSQHHHHSLHHSHDHASHHHESHQEHHQSISVVHEPSHEESDYVHGHKSHSHDHHHHGHHHSHDHACHHREPHQDHHQSISVAREPIHEESGYVPGHNSHGHDHHHHDQKDDLIGAIKDDGGPSVHNHKHHGHGESRGEGQNNLDDHHCCDQHGRQNHHVHGQQNDHHGHDHNDHDGHPHLVQSSDEVKHSHHNPIDSSRSPHNDSHGGHTHRSSQATSRCCHGNHPNSSHTSDLGIKSDEHNDSLEAKKHEPQKHHHIDHNMEGIFLHVLADTLGSVGVVVATLLIKYKGWLVADPACSIFISVLIISSVVPLLRNSAEILLQRVPRNHEHDLNLALDKVMSIKGIHGIQNMHVWSFTNKDVVGTLHLHISAETDRDSSREQVSRLLHDAGINDLTLQVECVGGK
eukprot:TRINITY_DN4017_c0_g1_i4.p1 TRINITY_DN4017_c0_g1~~TRINITY_DN4017_c0_g1_i4.p1  ORF type:complete len:960 (-),score=165.77 TRINITY_DN4017_c0_g1_i4:576-3455(-)